MVDDTTVEKPGIVYGVADSQPLLLDTYRPQPAQEKGRAVILIHGGMWTGARGEWFHRIRHRRPPSRWRGWPEPLAGPLDDAQEAVRWSRVHAPEYDIDPNRVAAFGWSAGGQLAALLGTCETRQDYGSVSILSRVNLAVVLAADIDLAACTQPPARDEVIALLGGTPDEVPEQYFDASPLSWIDRGTVPILIIHGLQDDVVPIDQSCRFAAALRAAGVPTRHIELPDIGHHDLTWERVGPDVIGFLTQVIP